MHDQRKHDRVVAVPDLRDYFRNSVDTAIDKQGVDVDPHAAHYVVNLLTLFSRSDELYEEHGDVYGLRPLAMMMAERPWKAWCMVSRRGSVMKRLLAP